MHEESKEAAYVRRAVALKIVQDYSIDARQQADTDDSEQGSGYFVVKAAFNKIVRALKTRDNKSLRELIKAVVETFDGNLFAAIKKQQQQDNRYRIVPQKFLGRYVEFIETAAGLPK